MDINISAKINESLIALVCFEEYGTTLIFVRERGIDLNNLSTYGADD
jgi:hypothetical protein